jgi:two-component system response regulator YesN
MLKVIIVDDNVPSADGLARSIDFKSVGFECAGVAYNGRQALELVQKHQPNVVITDVRMPIMDGLELAKQLREEYPGIAIMILSAYDEFEYAKTAIDYGVAAYLLKPLDPKKLESIVAFLADIKNRIDSFSSALSSVSDRGNMERLYVCLQHADKSGAEAFIAAVLHADAAPSFTATQRAAAALVSSLQDFASRHLPADLNPCPDREVLLARVGAESRPDGLVRTATDLSARICEAVATARDSTTRHIVGAIVAYIDQNFTDPDLTSRQIMERFNVSQSYLCQIFKRFQCTGLNTYLTELRMAHAARLLSDRTVPIAAVAQQCGYADPHYFSRVFRKFHGLPPADYRRLHLQTANACASVAFDAEAVAP